MTETKRLNFGTGKIEGPNKELELSEGLRVYNHGDRCNPAHYGTVTKIEKTKWGTKFHIEPDTDREKYTVSPVMISANDECNGHTRIVPAEAHHRNKAENLLRSRVEMPHGGIEDYTRTDVEELAEELAQRAEKTSKEKEANT